MPIYMSIKGQKQGIIAGDSTSVNHKNYWDVNSLTSGGSMPTDPASGLPTGARTYQQLVITLPFGGHAPSIWTAFDTNENLNTVFFQFYDVQNILRARMTLTNANIVQISHVAAAGPPVLQVAFVYQKIEYIAATTFLANFSNVV